MSDSLWQALYILLRISSLGYRFFTQVEDDFAILSVKLGIKLGVPIFYPFPILFMLNWSGTFLSELTMAKDVLQHLHRGPL